MSRIAVTVLVATICVSSLCAQEKGATYTDPDNTDADFPLQGEYAGSGWGAQVVAGGSGRFSAMLYPGGLPGAGWNRAKRQQLQGSRSGGDVLELRNDEFTLQVQQGQALLSNATGRVYGRLLKRERVSPTLGLQPPAGARVLFDGTSTSEFVKAQMTADHLLRMGPVTKDKVGDFRLHLEFRLPYMPSARGQGRANSGVYIQQRYEVQILDSFGLEGLKNECGAMYEQRPPDVNAALPPLTWQTYDVWFRQPRWSADGTKKLEPARITVYHNGIPIHWNYALTNKTGGGKQEGPEEFPIALQDHGNPVVFRNIWIVPGQGDYPVRTTTAATSRYQARTGLLRRVFRCRH